MKEFNLIIWLTQLGLSVALPLAGFTLLALWLQDKFGLGNWILVCGIFIGFISAIDGLRVSLKAMDRMSRHNSKKDEPPPTSFNNHI